MLLTLRLFYFQGHPTIVFTLNTLKPLIRLSRVTLDIWKCILSGAIKFVSKFSVILGKLESFRNYMGFSVIFPKILAAIKSFTKGKIFLITLCIAFSFPNILGFLFLRVKKKINLVSEMGKNRVQKIIGNLLDKLRKLYMNRTVI